MKDFYEKVFEPIIKNKDELNIELNPIQISNEEFDENIDNQILNEIRQCRFMICDLSYAGPSVYFEAGYALGEVLK